MTIKTLLLTLLCLALAACGGSSTPAPAPAASSIKIGLLVSGTATDHGWNQLAWDSLNLYSAAHSGTTETSKLESVKDTDAADLMRKYDSQGYGLIIAHGYEYLQPAKDVAASLKTKIVVSGGDVDSPAFQSLLYDLSGASYQLGVIAAKVSKTGKLGFIGGAPYPTVTAMQRGFEAGALSVNPKATVTSQYTGFDDPNKAKQQTEAFIAQGIDVIMQNVDAASKGVFEAVKEYNSNPAGTKPGFAVYTFGANSDQNANDICPDYTLASAVIKMDVAFDRAIQQVRDGTFKGGIVKEDLASGISVAVLNPRLIGKVIDADTQKLVEHAGMDLVSGKVKIPEEIK